MAAWDESSDDPPAEAVDATEGPHGPLDTIERLLVEVEPAPPVLPPGTLIGEAFRIDRLLGVGGMGMVYLATDLRLRREVALKFQTVDGGFARAQREAKVLARLSHPNVITVHEVGVHADRLYIAMEYVDGQSLASWLKTPRRWGEILDVFLRAGHGLVAAHAAGLIHRDFKPDNVLCGHDGRVRVADFGLARDIDGRELDVGDGRGAAGLTVAGAGTPRYMSPEQARGDELDARTDQYSFCVAAGEALATRGPRWLRAMLERGAAPEPARRWPSLAALLDQIQRRRRRARIAIGAGATLAVAGLAVAGGWYVGRADVEDPCGGAEAAMASTWNDGRRSALADALGAPGASTLVTLDGYAREWRVAHRETCLATRVRGEQSEANLDLRMSCLDMARARLGAVVELLTREPASRAGARAVVDALPSVLDCAAIGATLSVAPYSIDTPQRIRLDALVPQIAMARTLFNAGFYPRAVPVAEAAVAAARAEDYPPLLAEALLVVGELHVNQGHPDEGLVEMTEALHAALRGRHDVFVVDGGLMLASYLAEAKRLAAAEEWLAITEAFVHRLGRERGYEGAVLRVRARIRRQQRRPAEAVEFARRALTLDQARGDAVTSMLDRVELGVSLVELVHLDEADAVLTPLESVDVAVVGVSRHGAALRTLAQVRYLRGDHASAERILLRADAEVDPTWRDQPSADLIELLGVRAALAQARGDLPESLALREREVAMMRLMPSLDPDNLAEALGNHAIALASVGRIDDALARAIESREAFEAIHAPDDAELVVPQQIVGTLQRYAGQPDEALRTLQAAAALAARELPADAEPRVNTEVELALTLLALRRPAEAVPLLRGAVPALERGARAGNLAEARFALARALVESGGDRGEARALARGARDEWARIAGADAARAEAEAWLAAHGGP